MCTERAASDIVALFGSVFGVAALPAWGLHKADRAAALARHGDSARPVPSAPGLSASASQVGEAAAGAAAAVAESTAKAESAAALPPHADLTVTSPGLRVWLNYVLFPDDAALHRHVCEWNATAARLRG